MTARNWREMTLDDTFSQPLATQAKVSVKQVVRAHDGKADIHDPALAFLAVFAAVFMLP